MEPIETGNAFLREMGKRIRMRRKRLRLTQDELAELVDATPQMISSAELGKKALRPENLFKICRALGVSADYILSGTVVEQDVQDLQKLLYPLSPEQLLTVQEIVRSCTQLCTPSKP